MPAPLVAAIALGSALASDPTAPAAARLDEGIRQYREGLLSEAVSSLDEAIGQLSREATPDRASLRRAHVYRGAALVGLYQEESAKDTFREALRLQPDLRLATGEFPDRVIRVFEAARMGKQGSVMQRPRDVPKKAGLGAAGVAAIAGGAALLVGGAAVATSGGTPPATPSPSPSPTPDPRLQVVPTSGSGPGQIVFVAADPPPGATMLGCAANPGTCASRLQLAFRVRIDGQAYPEYSFGVGLYDAAGRTCLWRGIPDVGEGFLRWPSGVTQDIVIAFPGPLTCTPPFTATEMSAQVEGWISPNDSRALLLQRWRLSYTFER